MTGWDLGGGGGNSFPFENVNDYVRGRVVDLTERQQTHIDTKEPQFWDAEHKQPMMMQALTLQTELRDPNNPSDDGKRVVLLKGSKKSEDMTTMSAVLDAVKESTGQTTLGYGGELTVQYVGERKAKGGGNYKAKCYKAWYTPPAMELEQPQQDRVVAAQQVDNAMAQPAYSNFQNPPGGQQGAPGNGQPPAGGQGWTPPPGGAQQQQQGPPPGGGMHQPPPQHYSQPGATGHQPPPGAGSQPGTQPQPQGQPNPAGSYQQPQGPGTQQQQWPPQDTGPAPEWAQQEPPADPWSSGGQSVVGAAPQNDPWGAPPQQHPAWGPQDGSLAAQSQPPQDQPPAQQNGGQPVADPITQAQVEAVKAANVDPAQVFGPDYLTRIVG